MERLLRRLQSPARLVLPIWRSALARRPVLRTAAERPVLLSAATGLAVTARRVASRPHCTRRNADGAPPPFRPAHGVVRYAGEGADFAAYCAPADEYWGGMDL